MKDAKVTVHGFGRGLVHFSAKKRIWPRDVRPKTWTCPLGTAEGDSPIFAAMRLACRRSAPFAAKIGTVPMNGKGVGDAETHVFA